MKNAAAAAMGRIKSPKKAETSAANGAKGGRPPEGGYSMSEIKTEAKKLGVSITRRAATINGSTAYKAEGGDFNPAAVYTKSDLIQKLFY